jgi:hypothetical protein
MQPYSLIPAEKIFLVSDDLTVLLLKQEGASQGADQNLIGCDKFGNVLWQVTPPSRPDRFTDVELVDGSLSAYSFSGYVCRIAMKTGQIHELIFTK